MTEHIQAKLSMWAMLLPLLWVTAFGVVGAGADTLWYDEFWSLFIVQAAGGRSWWDYAQTAAYYLHENPADVTITPLRPWDTPQDYTTQLTGQTQDRPRLFYVVDTSQPTHKGAAFTEHLPSSYRDCGPISAPAPLTIRLYERTCQTE
jgi:hypothetical protein